MPGSRSRGPDRFGSHHYYRLALPFHDLLYHPAIPPPGVEKPRLGDTLFCGVSLDISPADDGKFRHCEHWKKIERIARGKAAVSIFDPNGRTRFGIGAAVVRAEVVPLAEMVHASVYAQLVRSRTQPCSLPAWTAAHPPGAAVRGGVSIPRYCSIERPGGHHGSGSDQSILTRIFGAAGVGALGPVR
jgi:hypothetical protein